MQSQLSGISCWFKSRGISDVEIMMETMANFLIKNGQIVTQSTTDKDLGDFCINKSAEFKYYAKEFLEQNNYSKFIHNDHFCKCGSRWVERRNKVSGNSFYGCLSYPKCKNIKANEINLRNTIQVQ